MVSDAGTNYIAEIFKEFSRKLNIEQAVSSSYKHQSNGQLETYIKFVKRTVKG